MKNCKTKKFQNTKEYEIALRVINTLRHDQKYFWFDNVGNLYLNMESIEDWETIVKEVLRCEQDVKRERK